MVLGYHGAWSSIINILTRVQQSLVTALKYVLAFLHHLEQYLIYLFFSSQENPCSPLQIQIH